MKEFHAPHLGRTVKMGRRRPPAAGPRLHLGHYLRASLPPVPPTCDYTPLAAAALNDVMLNDQLGDCVIAEAGHFLGVETGNASGGAPFVYSDAQLVRDYAAIGGYNPNDPSTDQGCMIPDALAYYTAHGFADGSKLAGWLAVDATNRSEVEAALYLFENLCLGIELPDQWVEPFPAGPGFVWDVAGPPDPNNGHCVGGYGGTDAGVIIVSWGMPGIVTWGALAHYCAPANGGELYTRVSIAQLSRATGKAPNGLSLSQLIADFDTMGGHVPIPAPPAPAPVPTPGVPPTSAQAQAWARAGVAAGPSVQSRTLAESLAAAGIARHWPH